MLYTQLIVEVGQRVQPERLVHRGHKVLQVLMGQPEHKALKVRQAQQALRGQPERRDFKA